MWTAVVITTADEAQRHAFEQQIRDKHDRSELPLDLPIHVVSDPPGPRIGMWYINLTEGIHVLCVCKHTRVTVYVWDVISVTDQCY